MASSGKELEQELREAGSSLLEPPSSAEELLPLLDKVENLLSSVEQTPTVSMKNALSPVLKALIGDKLLRHLDVDVKVAVASCVSEITRITAPDAPYDDDQMKEVFRLIVTSFESLPDKTSRSYTKRTSMLETVAKVRSCVVMLDLECDALIAEMFQYFLKAIRNYHPESVFASMETIMILIVEESEDISLNLLSPLLSCLRKDNEEILPIARKLAENVIQSCATKLKPYLIQAIKSFDTQLDHYSNVVESICQGNSGTLVQNEAITDKDAVSNTAPKEAVNSTQADFTVKKSSEHVAGNGAAHTGKNDPLSDLSLAVTQEQDDHLSQPMDLDVTKTNTNDSKEQVKVAGVEKGDKPTIDDVGNESIVAQKLESADASLVDSEGQANQIEESKDENVKDPSIKPQNDSTVKKSAASEDEKQDELSAPKAAKDDCAKVYAPCRNESHQDERLTEKTSHQKKEGASAKRTRESLDDFLRKASDVGIDTAEDSNDGLKKGDVAGSCNEEKPLKQLSKKLDIRVDNLDNSRQKKDKKNQVQMKAAGNYVKRTAGDENDLMPSTKAAAKVGKARKSSEGLSNTNSKRKQTPSKETSSGVEEYGENLLGSRIKVWWPKDRRFYKGVVDSYDSAKKKHLVLYDDGDQEILNLKRQRWEFIDGCGEGAFGPRSLDYSSEMPKRKKAKTSAGQSGKQGKMGASGKSVIGEGSSGAAASKVGKKSKGAKNAENKLKEGMKGVRKKHEDSCGEGEGHDARSVDKSSETPSKSASKPKKDEIGKDEVNRLGNKSKQETSKISKCKELKTAPNAKNKLLQKSAGNANVKTSKESETELSKVKDKEEKTPKDSVKTTPEKSKGKSLGSSISKTKPSEANSGKKRSR